MYKNYNFHLKSCLSSCTYNVTRRSTSVTKVGATYIVLRHLNEEADLGKLFWSICYFKHIYATKKLENKVVLSFENIVCGATWSLVTM